MSRKNLTLVRLCVYSRIAGAMWRGLFSMLAMRSNLNFNVWQHPLFWTSTLVTAPVAFLWNRKRKFVWGGEWTYQGIKACFPLLFALGFGISSLFINDTSGSINWFILLCVFDSLTTLVGPEYPANPHVEWIVHNLLKRPRPDGVFVE